MKYFTKEWYKENPKFFISRKKRIQDKKIFDEYYEHYKQIEPNLSENVEKINMHRVHDGQVLSSGFCDSNFHVNINPNTCCGNIKKIIFINAKVLEEKNLENTQWLFEEIYVQKDRYEMHILFWVGKGELEEMIIRFDDVELS